MRRIKVIVLTTLFTISTIDINWTSLRTEISSAVAATTKKKKKKTKSTSSRPQAPSESSSGGGPIGSTPLDPEEAKAVKEAYRLIREEKFEPASAKLYRLSRNPLLRDHREELKYKLGLSLMEMGLNQVAAVEFLRVAIKGKSRYLRQSLEKLSVAADALDFDVLLNLAISKIKVSEFPAVHKDMLFYRIGEFQMKKGDFAEAANSLNKVDQNSRYWYRAKYNQGLAFAQAEQPEKSAAAFDELYQAKISEHVTDDTRVAALIGKARAFYQAKKWDESIEAYREIPRDSNLWHDTIFESSWAMLRGAKFRSALSNFHSLHSPYYEKFYLPESLVLRAIVYLYICKFDELDKDLNLFEKIYGDLRKNIINYLSTKPDATKIYEDFSKSTHSEGRIPQLAVHKIEKENDYAQTERYLGNLHTELDRFEGKSSGWKNSPLGKYAKKLLTLRIKKTEKKLGITIKKHLFAIKSELRDQFEQVGFLRLEVINSQKEQVKKQMTKKDEEEDGESKQIDDKEDRKFYVQNGFDYWPFQGEYWLDELGNYHYLGVSNCQR